MYIKKLELLNFQVIENFNADFSGNIYFVTGDNELGKSTLLKAIGALLTGERDEVLRSGASKGFAKMIIGDDGEEFDVQLSFTENNPRGTMTIKQKSTGMQTNNVTMLQRIFGYQDFDAVEFARWSETAEGRRKQIAVVKSLMRPEIRERIDAIEAEVAELKAERTGVNRDVKTFDALVAAAREKLDEGDLEKYSQPIDMKSLMERQAVNAQLIEKAKTVRKALADRTAQIEGFSEEVEKVEKEYANKLAFLDAYEKQLKAEYEKAVAQAAQDREEAKMRREENIAAIKKARIDADTRKANCETWLAKYEANNPEKSDIPAQLAEAEKHNAKYALVEQYKQKKADFDKAAEKSQMIDEKVSQLAVDKENLIKSAELPIAGLSFTDDGLVLNGLPFVDGKVSDSQKMEIATKLIIASNPKVKVFRIARGESLGAKRLESIIDIAKRNGFQGFIETVVRGQEEMKIEEYTER